MFRESISCYKMMGNINLIGETTGAFSLDSVIESDKTLNIGCVYFFMFFNGNQVPLKRVWSQNFYE